MILFEAKSKTGNGGNTEEKQQEQPRKLHKCQRRHAKTPWEMVENGQETGEISDQGNHHDNHAENETDRF